MRTPTCATAGLVAVLVVAASGCSATPSGSEEPNRSAAPSVSVDPDSSVPAGLQQAAGENGLSIEPSLPATFPGLGAVRSYAVTKGSASVGHLVVKSGQSPAAMDKLLNSLAGRLGKPQDPITTARGTFAVVRQPTGRFAAAALGSTLVLIQAPTTSAVKSLAEVAQGV